MNNSFVGTSNKLFQNLKAKGKISDTQLKYFTNQYKKVIDLGKLYLLPKIHKRLAKVTNLGKLYLLPKINVWQMLLESL